MLLKNIVRSVHYELNKAQTRSIFLRKQALKFMSHSKMGRVLCLYVKVVVIWRHEIYVIECD